MQVSIDVSTDTKLTSVEISVEIWLSVDQVLTDVSADMSVKYQLTCICQLIHPPTWTIVHTIQWGRKREHKNPMGEACMLDILESKLFSTKLSIINLYLPMHEFTKVVT